MQQFRVRVHKVEAYTDQEGSSCKRIELVQDLELPFKMRPEQRGLQETIGQHMQVLIRLPPCLGCSTLPKIVLYLTEHEYEALGVSFEVNRVYEVTLEGQALKFNQAKS